KLFASWGLYNDWPRMCTIIPQSMDSFRASPDCWKKQRKQFQNYQASRNKYDGTWGIDQKPAALSTRFL
ncbi:MAG: hypothetical protein KZQ65_02285, partial [Candidatus Thiodiazotropha sp. (ex Gloverina cf. vestifex)]|nr:hypothetical protein [Candidatus Thiodiazotropha sp. (ex Gloverina cf. vestifex)]